MARKLGRGGTNMWDLKGELEEQKVAQQQSHMSAIRE